MIILTPCTPVKIAMHYDMQESRSLVQVGFRVLLKVIANLHQGDSGEEDRPIVIRLRHFYRHRRCS
jgi:hypothetical protein